MNIRTVSGAPLSRLGVGGARIGSIGNPVPLAEIRRMLARAIDLEINVFDTADIYGQGDSERVIGAATRSQRDRCFIITKVGQQFSAKMRLIRPLKPFLKPLAQMSAAARKSVVARRASSIGTNFEAKYLRSALESSLRRLKLDFVDCLLLHGPSAETVANGGAVEMLFKAKEQGLVRHFGISCDDLETANQSLALPADSLVQLPVNLLGRDDTDDLGAAFQGKSIAILAREAIRLHPELPATEAVLRYVRREHVASTIIGVSSVAHLDQLAATAYRSTPSTGR